MAFQEISGKQIKDGAVESVDIKDGSVAKADLDTTVQTSLGSADTAVQNIIAGTNITVSRAGNDVTINASGGSGGGAAGVQSVTAGSSVVVIGGTASDPTVDVAQSIKDAATNSHTHNNKPVLDRIIQSGTESNLDLSFPVYTYDRTVGPGVHDGFAWYYDALEFTVLVPPGTALLPGGKWVTATSTMMYSPSGNKLALIYVDSTGIKVIETAEGDKSAYPSCPSDAVPIVEVDVTGNYPNVQQEARTGIRRTKGKTSPSNPVPGEEWYDSLKKVWNYWNGTAWVAGGGGGGGGNRRTLNLPLSYTAAGDWVVLFYGTVPAGKSLKVWFAGCGSDSAGGSPLIDVLSGGVSSYSTSALDAGNGATALATVVAGTVAEIRLKNNGAGGANIWGYVTISIE